MKGYKGFDNELKCRDFQYEVGETYETDKAELCKSGFHFCEAPLDVFNYYPPAIDGKLNRYCEVEAEDVSDEKDDDSKRVSKKLSVGAEIGIPGLVKAQIEYVKERGGKENKKKGDGSVNTAQGYGSVNTAQGSWSVNTAQGHGSVNTAQGSWSVNTAQGDGSVNTAQGDGSVNTAQGYGSVNVSVAPYCRNESGTASVNVGWGKDNKCKGTIGAYIVLAEFDEWDGEKYPLKGAKMGLIDGEALKADTWYTLKKGEFVEVDE